MHDVPSLCATSSFNVTRDNKITLKKDGYFGIVCFNTVGYLDIPDWDVYKDKIFKGGIGYSEERLLVASNEIG
ncbi:hypothetical protein M3197_12435 [Sporosarcina aquimarina]|nr:hypothetical protein [Sporosarcina aquimarina]